MRTIAAFGAVVLLVSGCAHPAPVHQPGPGFTKPISFSILEDYDKGEDLRQVEADFRLFKELGVTTWRGSFGWDDYEPSLGVYDFDWLHRFANLAASYGIRLRPYVAYTPEWAALGGPDSKVWNDPPAQVADWRDFASHMAAAMKRHPNVLSFEIYNEENARMWWDGSPREYRRVLRAGSKAVRTAAGGDQVLFGGMTYPDLKWLEAVCPGDGASFDILPIHAYPETWTKANVVVENYLDSGKPGFFRNEFLPEADSACGRKSIWLNEIGFATVPGKKSERDQANWWVRAMGTFVAAPRVEHIGIYEIKEPPRREGMIGGPENYYLGLTYHDRKKKLAFHTVKRLVSLLNTGTITVADGQADPEVTGGTSGELYHHLFIRPDGRQVLFLWDKTGAPTLAVRLATPGKAVTEYALDGTGRPFPAFDGTTLTGVKLAPGQARVFEIAP